MEGGRRSLNDIATEEVLAMKGRRRMRQADMARVLGVAQSGVSDRLNGRREWQLSELEILARHWRIPVGVLLGMQETPQGPSDDHPRGGMLPRLDSNQQPFDSGNTVARGVFPLDGDRIAAA